MRTHYIIPLCFLFLAAPAFASSPGMSEGPPGCAWNGTVMEMGNSNAAVRLDTMRGTCMYEPGPCGKEGDIVTVEVDSSTDASKDAVLEVWVTGDADGKLAASLDHPGCTKTPLPQTP